MPRHSIVRSKTTTTGGTADLPGQPALDRAFTDVQELGRPIPGVQEAQEAQRFPKLRGRH